jgi:hypothetical protein
VEFSSSAQSFSPDSRNVLAFPGSAQQFAAACNNSMPIDNFGILHRCVQPSEHSGNYTHHITSSALSLANSIFSPHSAFVCFVFFLQQTANITLNNIN